MNKNKLRVGFQRFLCITSVFGCSVLISGVTAQETIPAAGGDASGSGGTVSYSIGQAFYSAFSGETGYIAEGVQQAYEIYDVTAVEDLTGIQLMVSAFPNPVNDMLNIKVGDLSSESLSFQLYSLNGALITEQKITSGNTELNMAGKLPGIYFLKVTDNLKEIKTFKIIKN